MDPLTPTQRRALRAKAHALDPVVIVGHQGLTAPVLHEIDVALLAHELVKVRVLGDDRDAREAMLDQACFALDCAPVQHLGKVLVLWRPNLERSKAKAAPKRKPTTKPAIAKPIARKKPAQRTPVDLIRERRRNRGDAVARRGESEVPRDASRPRRRQARA
jgi:RNA-binding protein